MQLSPSSLLAVTESVGGREEPVTLRSTAAATAEDDSAAGVGMVAIAAVVVEEEEAEAEAEEGKDEGVIVVEGRGCAFQG